MKQRSDAKIDKDVEKYVADRQLKGGPKKVKYKGTNVVPPFRDKDGGIVKKSGESYKQYTPSRFTGSPFKASPLYKNKAIYGMQQEAAESKSQQRLMGMVYAYLKGEMPDASDEVKKIASGMSLSLIHI